MNSRWRGIAFSYHPLVELGKSDTNPITCSLGQWDEELDHEAELAVQGRHFETGEKLKAGRVKAK